MNQDLINKAVNNLVQMPSERPPSQRTFSKPEQQLISWLFATMRIAWGTAKFNSQFGEDDDVRYSKRYWGEKIAQYTRLELAAMLDAVDRERIAGNDKFTFPDIPKILSLHTAQWERQCHKPFVAERAIENLTRKEQNKRVGNEQLAKLHEQVATDGE